MIVIAQRYHGRQRPSQPGIASESRVKTVLAADGERLGVRAGVGMDGAGVEATSQTHTQHAARADGASLETDCRRALATVVSSEDVGSLTIFLKFTSRSL